MTPEERQEIKSELGELLATLIQAPGIIFEESPTATTEQVIMARERANDVLEQIMTRIEAAYERGHEQGFESGVWSATE